MSGSIASPRAFPPLPSLALRFALVASVLLFVGSTFAAAIVEPLVPWMGRAVGALTSDFTILDVALVREREQTFVEFHGNLTHVVQVGTGRVLPMGYGPVPAGWYEVRLTTGGILQQALFFLIIVLAWPATGRGLALRCLLAMPLAALLILQHVAVTVLAEMWFPFHDELAPQEFWPLLTWSRFLMGGGGLVLAMALGAMTIALASHLERRLRSRALVLAGASR